MKCFLTKSEVGQTEADESDLFISRRKDLPVQSKATCSRSPALIASIKLKEQMHSHISHRCDSTRTEIPAESLNFRQMLQMQRQKTQHLGSMSTLASRHNVRSG